jgi:SPP1 family predicted phage head-tail adaptor
MAGTKLTDIGQMRTRVTLLTSSLTTDAGGAQKPVYATGDTVWGRVKFAYGAELIAAQAANVEAPVTVVIRYRSDVTAAWGLRISSIDYKLIAPPNDMENRHEHLELKAVSVRSTL